MNAPVSIFEGPYQVKTHKKLVKWQSPTLQGWALKWNASLVKELVATPSPLSPPFGSYICCWTARLGLFLSASALSSLKWNMCGTFLQSLFFSNQPVRFIVRVWILKIQCEVNFAWNGYPGWTVIEPTYFTTTQLYFNLKAELNK